jgi:predicted tellurium resistance membrane protein TerC
VIKLMDRFPVIITLGGMLLGWIAGTMAVTDPAVLGQVPTLSPGQPGTVPEVLASVRYGAGLAGALLVLAIGLLLKRRAAAAAT